MIHDHRQCINFNLDFFLLTGEKYSDIFRFSVHKGCENNCYNCEALWKCRASKETMQTHLCPYAQMPEKKHSMLKYLLKCFYCSRRSLYTPFFMTWFSIMFNHIQDRHTSALLVCLYPSAQQKKLQECDSAFECCSWLLCSPDLLENMQLLLLRLE